MKKMTLMTAVILIIGTVFAVWWSSAQPTQINRVEVTSFPKKIDPNCNFGRAKLYDQCGDQGELFDQALAQARAENKMLLISAGAEWCIWCHVFSEYVKGSHTKMNYIAGGPSDPSYTPVTLNERPETDPSAEAAALNAFVSANFILLHLDTQMAPGGDMVLDQTGAVDHMGFGIPFIFAVDGAGRYSAALDTNSLETRRDTFDWYRGYDRPALLAALKDMRGLIE